MLFLSSRTFLYLRLHSRHSVMRITTATATTPADTAMNIGPRIFLWVEGVAIPVGVASIVGTTDSLLTTTNVDSAPPVAIVIECDNQEVVELVTGSTLDAVVGGRFGESIDRLGARVELDSEL